MMKRLLLSALILAVAALAAAAQSEAVLRSASGRVEVMLPGGSWTAAVAGTHLPLGASISTGFQSEATLEIGASTIQVRPLTRMRIDELARSGSTVSTELFLRVGRVRADVKSAEGLLQDFKVRSPISTAAVRGTLFGFDGVNLDVDNGLVNLSNQFHQSTSVGGGEQGSVTDDNPPVGGEQNLQDQSQTDTSTGNTPLPPPPPPTSGTIRIQWSLPPAA